MMQEIMSEEKATVIITPQVASQISCLHNQCPKNTEWSGLLIYRILEGSIEEKKNLKIQTEAIFPMNFGTGLFTEFEGGLDYLTMLQQFPQIDPLSEKKDPAWMIGKIHTHVHINTFHSGTDITDLHDSISKFPMFLSLIVNYATDTDCKIAIEAKTEKTTVEWFNWSLPNFKLKYKKPREKKETTAKACYIIDCNVVYQQDEWFIQQTKKVKTEAEAAAKAKIVAYTPPKYRSYSSQMGFQYGSNKIQEVYVKPVKDKDGIRSINPHHYSSKTYQQVLGEVDDLLLLGESTGYTAKKGLDKAAEWIEFKEVDKYIKAIKQHFSTWYFQNYWNHGYAMAEESEVGYAVLKFLAFHENVWLTKHLTVAVNEYLDGVEQEEHAKQSVQ